MTSILVCIMFLHVLFFEPIAGFALDFRQIAWPKARRNYNLSAEHTDIVLQTYGRIIAGSSVTYMPLTTPRLYASDMLADKSPFHVPCSHAYLVFAAHNTPVEVIEFTISESTAWDLPDSKRQDCYKIGINYALLSSY
uniref:Uncharacterized protein n=1 Tax=Ditylenchus dipsaci TaxID=166011 RepID=A0A915ELZ7_9BILA